MFNKYFSPPTLGSIVSTPVGNSAPIISSPIDIYLVTDGTVLIGSLSIGDADNDSQVVTLTATSGTLSFGSPPTGISFLAGSYIAKNMQFTGTLANINNALTDLFYTADSGFYGSDTIHI